ncbi:hypothetical protein BDQ17DRAFT_1434373 [Cyathus striatus]|nr:hypothetical protein BDQ17DRAFT_1434373 [Cyathus striatus]
MERDTEVVEASGHVQKKHKDGSEKAVIVNQGIESFVDRALTKKEQDQANTRLLKWFIHGNIPFSQADSPIFRKWIEGI